MKFDKKKILALSLALCMLAIMSFSTLAWFNAKDSVTNRFYVATAVGGDPSEPDEIFSVDIWEHVDKNGNGAVDAGDEKDQDGLEFRNIVPGVYYDKKPYVENTGEHEQWVRVMVSVSEGGAWREILPAGYDLATMFVGYDDTLWAREEEPIYDRTADTLTYVFYLKDTLVPANMACIFSGVKFPAHLTQTEFAKVGGDFRITVKADAMQSAAIPAATAEEAFAYIGWDAGQAYVNPAP